MTFLVQLLDFYTKKKKKSLFKQTIILDLNFINI